MSIQLTKYVWGWCGGGYEEGSTGTRLSELCSVLLKLALLPRNDFSLYIILVVVTLSQQLLIFFLIFDKLLQAQESEDSF